MGGIGQFNHQNLDLWWCPVTGFLLSNEAHPSLTTDVRVECSDKEKAECSLSLWSKSPQRQVQKNNNPCERIVEIVLCSALWFDDKLPWRAMQGHFAVNNKYFFVLTEEQHILSACYKQLMWKKLKSQMTIGSSTLESEWPKDAHTDSQTYSHYHKLLACANMSSG